MARSLLLQTVFVLSAVIDSTAQAQTNTTEAETNGTLTYTVYRAPGGAEAEAISQSGAAALCREKESYLATIASCDEHKLATLALNKSELAPEWDDWVITGGSDSAEEGTWVWKYGPPGVVGKTFFVTGQGCKQDYCNWYEPWGEPNNQEGSESCLVVGKSAEWHDVGDGDGDKDEWSEENTRRYYMCQSWTSGEAASATDVACPDTSAYAGGAGRLAAPWLCASFAMGVIVEMLA